MSSLRSLAAAVALSLTALPVAIPTDVFAAEPRGDWLDIEVGKSVVIETPKNATAIAITDPEVADIVPLASANKIQVQGKSVGTTDLIIQLGPGVEPTRFEITVHTDLTDLVRRVSEIVEGEPPRVYPLRERIVVEGPVADLDTLEQVASVARIYDDEFVNLMSVKGDHQVQLEVVFAEISRTAFRELGVNWFFDTPEFGVTMEGPIFSGATLGLPEDGLITGAGIRAPGTGFTTMAAIPIQGGGLGAVLSVVDDNQIGKLIARPTLACLSGQQCEFLAGGRFPVASISSNGQPMVKLEDYGIKLSFVPTVLAGDVIDLRIQIESSELDEAHGNQFGAALFSRGAKGHVRLDNGLTFALGGMVQERSAFKRAQVPVLGSIPVVGSLFRYVRHTRDELELMIFVTPRLVRPLGPGEVPAPPGTTEDNNPTDLELFLLGMDHRAGSRTAEPTGDIGLER